jgi:hypothetical protein
MTLFPITKIMVTIVDNSKDEKKSKTPIVTYITEVKIFLSPEDSILNTVACKEPITPMIVRQAGEQTCEHYKRVAAMMELLSGNGFNFVAKEGAVYCYSNEVEAGAAKQLLLAAGFRDREFQIVLEYTRGWGML